MDKLRVRPIKRMARRGAGVVMIALAVALTLAGCDAGRQRTNTTATNTSTPTATARPSDWTVISEAAGAAQAPASIQTIYRMGPQDSSGAYAAIQRSTDAGFTWTAAAWPRVAGARLPADLDGASVQWDPATPHVVFLWLQLSNDAACPTIDEVPIPVINGIARATSTTGKLCQLTYVSDDAGATWRAVTPPAPLTGQFGGLELTGVAPTAGSLIARGARLYALFLPSVQGNSNALRLAASDDGGASWRLLDGRIATAGQEIMDYTATLDGKTLFALTEPKGFTSATASGETLPPVQFWSSADSGATWTRGATPPGQRMDGLAAAQDPATGAPIAYLLSDRDFIELHLYASLDGGHSWSHSVDTATREEGGDSLHVLTPLPDGGVALLGYRGDDPYPAQGGPLSVWRYDWTTAPVVTAPSNIAIVSQVDAAPLPGGGIRLWLTGLPNGGGRGSLLEYSDLAS